MPSTPSVVVADRATPKSNLKAGGLVVRGKGSAAEVLLVTSRSRPGRWILPKGSAEAGETTAQTATREIAEEAGVRGALMLEIGSVRRETQHITYFLFRFDSDVGWVEDTIRERRWVALHQAERHLEQGDLHAIVSRARKLLLSS